MNYDMFFIVYLELIKEEVIYFQVKVYLGM